MLYLRKYFRWKFKKQIKHILRENTDSTQQNGARWKANGVIGLIQGKECPPLSDLHNHTFLHIWIDRGGFSRKFFFNCYSNSKEVLLNVSCVCSSAATHLAINNSFFFNVDRQIFCFTHFTAITTKMFST